MISNISQKKNIIESSKILVICAILVSSFFYYYFFTRMTIFLMLGIIPLFIPAIFVTEKNILYFLLFLLPNERMLVHMDSGFTLLPVYIVITFIRIIFNNKVKLTMGFIILEILLFSSMLMKNILLREGILDFDIIRVMLNFIIICYCIEDSDEISTRKAVVWFSSGCLISGFLGLLYRIQLNSDIFANRFSGINNDPNYYGVALALSISLLLVQYLQSGKIRNVVISIVLFILGSLSISKGYLVANIGNILLVILLFFKSSKKNRLYIIVLSLIIIMTLVISGLMKQLLSIYNLRFNVDDLSSGRLEIWSSYLHVLKSDIMFLLWGLGAWNKNTFSTYYGIDSVAHNIVLGGIASKGLVLTVVIILNYFYVWSINQRKYYQVKVKYALVIIVTILLGYSFLDAMTTNILQYGFLLYLLCAIDASKVKKR